MNASEEKQAFARGVADFCSRNGVPEFSAPLTKLAEYSDAFELSPEAFVAAVERMSKEAADDEYEVVKKKGFLRKMLPWLAAVGGGALALGYGSAWGRHAHATNDNNGPILGTLKSIAEAASGERFRYVGRKNMVRRDKYHSPLSDSQYNNLVTYGTKDSPSTYDFKSVAK